MTLRDIQNRLIVMGYPVGTAGADGKYGAATEAGLTQALDRLESLEQKQPLVPGAAKAVKPIRTLPDSWLPAVPMLRIHAHWTAGTYNVTETDLEHYHIIWDGEGKPHRGKHSIADNSGNVGSEGTYAAHTRGANSGAIGVSMACMGGAIESPFSPGAWPMLQKQWDAMCLGIAQLCDTYRIPVSAKTVLSHAEVQGTLGIVQRGKWDFTRLAFDPTFVGARACGNKLRADVSALLK